MKKNIFTVSILFIAIILLALWFSSTPAYVPYTSTIFSEPSKYEGFRTSTLPLEYTNAKDHSAMDGSVMNFAINEKKTNCKSVSGYNGYGVFCDPTYASSETIDIYSQAKGSTDTEGYGYFNSRGPLQLNDNMKKQLTTRGMNASGTPSMIGGSPV